MPCLRRIDVLPSQELNKYTGIIVKHFKRELVSEAELSEHPKRYLYEIIAIGVYTENINETAVVYRSIQTNKVYIRPETEFFSEVDHEKYPKVNQKWRFEYLPKLTVSEVASWND